jgi:hypothetical protein
MEVEINAGCARRRKPGNLRIVENSWSANADREEGIWRRCRSEKLSAEARSALDKAGDYCLGIITTIHTTITSRIIGRRATSFLEVKSAATVCHYPIRIAEKVKAELIHYFTFPKNPSDSRRRRFTHLNEGNYSG